MLTLPAGFSVQIADLRAVAAKFGRLRDDAADLVQATSGALAGTGGMAGRDSELVRWRDRYDAITAAHWAAAVAAVDMLGAIAGRLHATADTYLVAEHHAERLGTPGGTGPPERDGHPAARVFSPPVAPPSSTGAVGPAVSDPLAQYYPGGDPELLRVAGAAWSRLGEGLTDAELAGDQAFQALLWTGHGATFSAMRTFWGRQFTPSGTEPLFNAVANSANGLGMACTDLAALIETTRANTRNAAADAVRDMSPLELPAELLSAVAWGIPQLELAVGTAALAVSYLNDSRAEYFFSLDRLLEELEFINEERLRRVAVPPPPDQPTGVGLDDVGRVAGLELGSTAWDRLLGPHPDPDAIHITTDRSTHILVGDRTGGGHASGAGKPGKSEFPPGWTPGRIVATAIDLARDPGTVEPADQGRWLVKGVRDGIKIEVVVNPDGSIRTAYPVSGPGVVTNPK